MLPSHSSSFSLVFFFMFMLEKKPDKGSRVTITLEKKLPAVKKVKFNKRNIFFCFWFSFTHLPPIFFRRFHQFGLFSHPHNKSLR